MIIMCARCEKQEEESKQDCEFCQDCFNETENKFNNIISRTDAAVGLLKSFDRRDEALEMAAFLDIFHPDMKESSKYELIRDCRRNK